MRLTYDLKSNNDSAGVARDGVSLSSESCRAGVVQSPCVLQRVNQSLVLGLSRIYICRHLLAHIHEV